MATFIDGCEHLELDIPAPMPLPPVPHDETVVVSEEAGVIAVGAEPNIIRVDR
jgi:hypothetical protein